MIARTRLTAIVTMVCVLVGAGAAFALPNYPHTATYRNTTGAAANDLHVSTQHTVISATAAPFPTAALDTPAIGDVTFSGANVANNAAVTVTVNTKFRSDILDKDDAFWTLNGANVGAVASNAGNIQPQFVDQLDGSVVVQLVNPDAPTSYSNLSIFTQGNNTTATDANYLSVAAATGTPVPLLIAASGSLPTGVTNVAQFFPSSLPDRFDAGSMFFGGDVFGAGANVPEPACAVLFVLAVVGSSFGRRLRVR